MKQPPNKYVTALMTGALVSLFILIPCLNCIITFFIGAIAVEWHIIRSSEPIEHLDAFKISLTASVLPMIVWMSFWIYNSGHYYLEFPGIALSIPLFAFLSTLSGLIMCSVSGANRRMRRKQTQKNLSAVLTDMKSEGLSAPATRNLLESVKYRQEVRSRDPVKQTVKIKNQTLPTRCEICHQSDQFDPVNNHCARCAVLK